MFTKRERKTNLIRNGLLRRGTLTSHQERLNCAYHTDIIFIRERQLYVKLAKCTYKFTMFSA